MVPANIEISLKCLKITSSTSLFLKLESIFPPWESDEAHCRASVLHLISRKTVLNNNNYSNKHLFKIMKSLRKQPEIEEQNSREVITVKRS